MKESRAREDGQCAETVLEVISEAQQRAVDALVERRCVEGGFLVEGGAPGDRALGPRPASYPSALASLASSLVLAAAGLDPYPAGLDPYPSATDTSALAPLAAYAHLPPLASEAFRAAHAIAPRASTASLLSASSDAGSDDELVIIMHSDAGGVDTTNAATCAFATAGARGRANVPGKVKKDAKVALALAPTPTPTPTPSPPRPTKIPMGRRIQQAVQPRTRGRKGTA